ncbi:MAG: hypothetical protein Q7U02_03170, partial [Desulfosalsimonadaceae bacterium]|nr:hypothetical protein [Desulfosalsimonadaceae bacterium]
MVKKAPAPKKAPAKKRVSASTATRSAKNTTSRKKATVKAKIRKGKAGSKANSLTETLATGLTTVFFVLFALFVAYVILHPKNDDTPQKKSRAAVEKKTPLVKNSKFDKPEFEIYPEEPVPSERSAA